MKDGDLQKSKTKKIEKRISNSVPNISNGGRIPATRLPESPEHIRQFISNTLGLKMDKCDSAKAKRIVNQEAKKMVIPLRPRSEMKAGNDLEWQVKSNVVRMIGSATNKVHKLQNEDKKKESKFKNTDSIQKVKTEKIGRREAPIITKIDQLTTTQSKNSKQESKSAQKKLDSSRIPKPKSANLERAHDKSNPEDSLLQFNKSLTEKQNTKKANVKSTKNVFNMLNIVPAETPSKIKKNKLNIDLSIGGKNKEMSLFEELKEAEQAAKGEKQKKRHIKKQFTLPDKEDNSITKLVKEKKKKNTGPTEESIKTLLQTGTHPQSTKLNKKTIPKKLLSTISAK